LSAGDSALLNEYFFLHRSQQSIADALGVSQMSVSRRLAGIVSRAQARVAARDHGPAA
jgi:DNA-directed RNA polymerase specialized sigma subunit